MNFTFYFENFTISCLVLPSFLIVLHTLIILIAFTCSSPYSSVSVHVHLFHSISLVEKRRLLTERLSVSGPTALWKEQTET